MKLKFSANVALDVDAAWVVIAKIKNVNRLLDPLKPAPDFIGERIAAITADR
jgi:hypothetical protein